MAADECLFKTLFYIFNDLVSCCRQALNTTVIISMLIVYLQK